MARLLALLLGCSLAGVILWRALSFRCSRGWPPGIIELHVVDARENPVERFGWTLLHEMNFQVVGRESTTSEFDWFPWDETPDDVWNPGVPETSHPGGVAIARVPAEKFKIQIQAKGLRETEVGPFEPETHPNRLYVVLTDLGVIAGTVTFNGQPVPRAEVRLVVGAWDGLLRNFEDHRTTTDESGAFRIAADPPGGPYYVRASKGGYAAGMIESAHIGEAPIEVRLHDGGSIEGRLQLSGARDPRGAEIELYRLESGGWDVAWDVYGHFVARADEAGCFRFEHVDAGPWLVRLKPPEHSDRWTEQRAADYVPFLVEVAEHEALQLDMDLARPLARLEGRMTTEGQAWSTVYVFLEPVGGPALELDVALADEDGRWTMHARVPGAYQLRVHGVDAYPRSREPFTVLVDLSREGVHWNHEFGPGEIVQYMGY